MIQLHAVTIQPMQFFIAQLVNFPFFIGKGTGRSANPYKFSSLFSLIIQKSLQLDSLSYGIYLFLTVCASDGNLLHVVVELHSQHPLFFIFFHSYIVLYLPLKKDGRLSKPKCQGGLVSTLRWRTAVLIIKRRQRYE